MPLSYMKENDLQSYVTIKKKYYLTEICIKKCVYINSFDHRLELRTISLEP